MTEPYSQNNLPFQQKSLFKGRPICEASMALLLSALVIGGCSTVPTPLTREEIKATASADREQARKTVEPMVGPLSLEEAIARGLKYNLDHRTRMLEQALAAGQLHAGNFDMLPRVLASAGYQSRNNSANSYSPLAGSDGPSTNAAPISADRTHHVSDLGLSWSVLDFGVSYFNSKQNADRVLVATERRRKAMHMLIQNIRSAFWRVASAQRLQADVNESIRQSEAALVDSRKVSDERVKAPVDALRFQRSLLENLRTLEGIERDLASARIELAQLINAPQGIPYSVAEPATFLLGDRLLGARLERLEDLAIANNADLHEQFYNARIAGTETRKALLRLFPALSINLADKRDSNSFLVNQHWHETAVQLSYNLVNLVSGPSQMDVAEAGARLAEQKRMAMQMAIVAQVHLARQDFDTALRQFKRADDIWRVDSQLSDYAAKGASTQTQSLMNSIASRTSAILSQLRRYQSLAQAHAAASRLQATLGLEPKIGNLDSQSLPELSALIGRALNDWDRIDAALVEPSPATELAKADDSTPASEADPPTPPIILARAEEPEAPQAAPAETTSTFGRRLNGVRFLGNSKISSAELEAAYADLIGQELHEIEFARLPARADAMYRERGVRNVRASIVGRTGDGIVTVRLQQGR